MDNRLYKLVYCSRNCIQGGNAEVTAQLEDILARARKNNPPLGITGALLYNAGNFAQVLEGPLASIEHIFEIIQRDPRHEDLIVIWSSPIPVRDFPEWSMAFTGSNDAGKMPLAAAAFEAVFANAAEGGEKLLSAVKHLVICEDDWVRLSAA